MSGSVVEKIIPDGFDLLLKMIENTFDHFLIRKGKY